MAGTTHDEDRERLKSALWFAIGKMVDEDCLRRGLNATPHFIGSLTELVWAQIETVAIDLESFAAHAGRSTVTTDDVLLLARRNPDLHGLMTAFVDERRSLSAAGGSGARAKRRAA